MKTYKEGDIVRVQGRTKDGSYSHGYKAGQLVVVAKQYPGGLIVVHGAHTAGGIATGSRIYQTMAVTNVKLAKQAMRWRGAYTNRRG